MEKQISPIKTRLSSVLSTEQRDKTYTYLNQCLDQYCEAEHLPRLRAFLYLSPVKKKHTYLKNFALAMEIRYVTAHGLVYKKSMKNLLYPKAKQAAQLTGTEIELWLYGGTGTPENRRAAIEAWADSAR